MKFGLKNDPSSSLVGLDFKFFPVLLLASLLMTWYGFDFDVQVFLCNVNLANIAMQGAELNCEDKKHLET